MFRLEAWRRKGNSDETRLEDDFRLQGRVSAATFAGVHMLGLSCSTAQVATSEEAHMTSFASSSIRRKRDREKPLGNILA